MLLALLVLNCAISPTAAAPPTARIVADLQIGPPAYRGPVRRVAFDAAGDAWMATADALYRVRDGTAEEVDVAPEGQQLALAPSGRVYARLVRGDAPSGLFTVELLEIPKKPIATLRLPKLPVGFGTLHLGGAGQLIVTATPLQDAEGLAGKFLYVFWSSDGHILSEVTLEGPRIAVVDVAGESLLLLGASDAIAFRNDGQRLWRLDGRFRKGALAAKGNIALLNPAELRAINEVHVFRDGQVTALRMEASVYDLALTADGSTGAVGIGTGQIVLLAPPSCDSKACATPRTVAGLSADSSTISPYKITALRFVNPDHLAIGNIKEVGATPPFRYPEGLPTLLSIGGSLLIQTPIQTMPLEQPATWSPSIDTSYGLPFFAAHTPHRVLIVRLDL